MADNAVQFELVSPEKLLLSEEVEMVVIPGAEGDFGVLPGHTPVISTVRPGIIHIFQGGSVKTRIFIAGGFAEVTAERCTVLAEEAIPLDDIVREDVEKALQDAIEDVSDAGDNASERSLAEQRAESARAKLASLDSQIYQ